jgi:hypothetical protein
VQPLVYHILFACPLHAALQTRFSDLLRLLSEAPHSASIPPHPPARLANCAASLKLQWQGAHAALLLLYYCLTTAARASLLRSLPLSNLPLRVPLSQVLYGHVNLKHRQLWKAEVSTALQPYDALQKFASSMHNATDPVM